MAHKKLRQRLLGGALFTLFVGASLTGMLAAKADEEGAPKVQASALVTTVMPRKGSIDTIVSGYGTVMGIPGKAKTLTFPQAGLVAEIRVAPGETVAKGSTILTLVTDPAARLAYEQAQSTLDFAKAELERTRQMRSQNLATESQVDQAKKNLLDAEAGLAAQKQLGTEAAQSEFKAPFDGVLLDVAVAPGDRIAPGAALAHMVPSDGGVQVLVGLSPADAHRVKAGMAASIGSVFSEDDAVEGKVVHVQGMVNPQSHLVDVAVQPTEADAGLMPGQATHASIVLSSDNATLVPRAAVQRDEDGAFLFQVVGDHAKKIAVTPGAETETDIAVEGKVDLRSKVVVDGAYELEDGMAVREAPAPAKDATEEKK